jgi:hypothetical protein
MSKTVGPAALSVIFDEGLTENTWLSVLMSDKTFCQKYRTFRDRHRDLEFFSRNQDGDLVFNSDGRYEDMMEMSPDVYKHCEVLCSKFTAFCFGVPHINTQEFFFMTSRFLQFYRD